MTERFRLVVSQYVPSYGRTIDRAYHLIPQLRAAYGIHDRILGRLPDVRPAPTKRTIGYILMLNRTERAIRNRIEHLKGLRT